MFDLTHPCAFRPREMDAVYEATYAPRRPDVAPEHTPQKPNRPGRRFPGIRVFSR